jgi:hypothetical protein
MKSTEYRAQGSGRRGRSSGLRAQGSGLRVKDLEMKGPHDCKAARPHDNVSCIIGDVL